MKCQKLLCVLLCAVLVFGTLAGCGEDERKVSVQQVAMLMETPIASVNRYGGVVVSQEETQIFKNESGTIAEMLVEEGDLVQEGDVLFTYDMADIELTIKKAELEVEQIANSIDVYAEQIDQLERERESATTTTDRLSYTVQIQDLELNQKEAIYNLSVKKTELETLRASAENNEVTAPVTGYVRSINLQGGTDEYGQALPTLTLVQSGAYRIKGMVNELNRYELMEGMPVIVRSRVDDSVIWRGSIEVILWDEPESAGGEMYGYVMDSAVAEGESMTDSNNYPFYITLEDTEGLMLGEHVYIEADYGQEDDLQEIWVDEGYVCLGDTSAYIWLASKNSTLQMREVTLGTHDEELGRYVITDGLSLEDYIAWPEADFEAGMPVVYYDASSFEEESSDEVTDDMAEDVPMEDVPMEDVPMEDTGIAVDDVANVIVEE